MRFDVLTLFPEMVQGLAQYGVTGRAINSGLLGLQPWNPRDYTADRHRTVDDRPYGGGPGMVMMVEPLQACLAAVREQADKPARVVYLSPQGQRFDQHAAKQMVAENEAMILIAGRYEGVDERFIENEVDEEWSIGDFVLSGGELAAMVMIDTMARLVPGVLGHGESAQQDSFMDGLLDYPHYTRPEVLAGQAVPEVLMSGNHDAIRRWRLKESLGRTWLRRPDLLEQYELQAEARELLDEFIEAYRKVHQTD
jgi:tRNA (guanine37-N1)-methyltransferase